MINSKLTKAATQPSTEDKVLKYLESIDWKLWEIMNMMKAVTESNPEEVKKTKA
jgi:hypothetical protein